jgi:hypothetical protein
VQEVPLRGIIDRKSITAHKSELPLRWLAGFLYSSGWTHAGRLLDDSLAFLVRGRSTAEPVPPWPTGAAKALRSATAAGFLDAGVTDCLALRRFRVGIRSYRIAGLAELFYLPIAMLIAFGAMIVYVYCVVPIWGLKICCLMLPDSARVSAVRWHRTSSGPMRMVAYAVLWFAGLLAALMGVVAKSFAMFWPPSLLRSLSPTGDWAIATPQGVVLFSALQDTFAFVPLNSVFYRGRFSNYYVLLGEERRGGKPAACTLCVAKLPHQFVEKHRLRVAPKDWRTWRQLVQRSRR